MKEKKLSQKILSPCIKICSLEINSGHCYGCGRNQQEISNWQTLDETTRQNIIAELPARLAKLPRRPKRLTKRKMLAKQKSKT